MYDVKKIFENITHDSLYKENTKRQPIALQKNKEDYRKGCVAVVGTKENLATDRGTKGFIVHSTEKLAEVSGNTTHWTPNPYTFLEYKDEKRRHIKGHKRQAIKQINSFVFDIDDENLELNDVKEKVIDSMIFSKLPEPTMIVETPRGFHLYYSISSPFYASRNTGFKAIKMAEKINSNLKKALSEHLPIDPACVPFGFFRMPNIENIKSYREELIDTEELIKWSYEYSEKSKEKKKETSEKTVSFHKKKQQRDDEWVTETLQVTDINSDTGIGRNTVIFTLGLYYYGKGREFDEAYDKLDEYNSNLNYPLGVREFERTVEQSYSGNYAGVSREYAVSIIETYLPKDVHFNNTKIYYTPPKPREERERSHNHERVQDVVDYLKAHTSESEPFIEGSITELTEKLGMSRSTFYDILSKGQFKQIVLKKEGKGRYATAKLFLKELFLHRLLNMAKKVAKNNQNKKMSFKNALLSVIKDFGDLNITQDNKSSYEAFMKQIKEYGNTDTSRTSKFIENSVLRI